MSFENVESFLEELVKKDHTLIAFVDIDDAIETAKNIVDLIECDEIRIQETCDKPISKEDAKKYIDGYRETTSVSSRRLDFYNRKTNEIGSLYLETYNSVDFDDYIDILTWLVFK